MATQDTDTSDLSDFEAGFLLGYFFAKGYGTEPTIEQFTEAVEALAVARGRKDA